MAETFSSYFMCFPIFSAHAVIRRVALRQPASISLHGAVFVTQLFLSRLSEDHSDVDHLSMAFLFFAKIIVVADFILSG